MPNPETPTAGFFTKWTIIAAFLVTLFVIIISTMLLGVKPMWLDMEREAVQHSLQYTESKETMLLGWIAEYNQLSTDIAYSEEQSKAAVVQVLTVQRNAIEGRIVAEASRIPEGAIVSSVITDFLNARSGE